MGLFHSSKTHLSSSSIFGARRVRNTRFSGDERELPQKTFWRRTFSTGWRRAGNTDDEEEEEDDTSRAHMRSSKSRKSGGSKKTTLPTRTTAYPTRPTTRGTPWRRRRVTVVTVLRRIIIMAAVGVALKSEGTKTPPPSVGRTRCA